MINIFNCFKKKCLKKFEFLKSEFGFEVIAIKEETFGIFITYKNLTTAVRVSFEPWEGGIFVLLCRLVDGRVPEYPIFIEPKTVLNSFYLDEVIVLKAPSEKIEQRFEKNISEADLEKILSRYANALQEYATDILIGDFGIFPELEKLVKK